MRLYRGQYSQNYSSHKIISSPKSLLFLVSPRIASDLRVGILSFLFLAMKQCLIAAKIAGSIGIPPRSVLNDFSRRGLNVCLIYEASISQHTLCIKKRLQKKKRVTALI